MQKWGREPDVSCNLSHSVSQEKVQACLVGTPDLAAEQRGRIFLVGDSHADHYAAALRAQLPDRVVRSSTVGWGCGYLREEDIAAHDLNRRLDCSLYRQLIDAFVATQVHPGDVIVVGHRWEEKKKYAHLMDGLHDLAVAAAAQGAWLVALDDIAELGVDNPLLCEKRVWRPFPSETCYKSLALVLADQTPLDEMLRRLADTERGVRPVTLRALYCVDGACGPYIGDMPVYRDGSHLTEAASAIGAQRLKTVLLGLLDTRP